MIPLPRILPLAMFPKHSALPLFTYSPILNELLCVQSVQVGKHQRIPFQFHYCLLSTAYSLPTDDNNTRTSNVLVTLRRVRVNIVIAENSKFCILSMRVSWQAAMRMYILPFGICLATQVFPH